MKLLLCATCGDLVKMTRELRACACGQARGRYLDDDATVEQTAGSMSIACNLEVVRDAIDWTTTCIRPRHAARPARDGSSRDGAGGGVPERAP